MIWARMLAYITGTVDQELLLRNEYLAAENRILRAQIQGRLLLSDAEKATLAESAHRLGRKALEELAAVAKPDTLLAWYRKLIASKFDGSKFRKSRGRPRVDAETERLARIIRENEDAEALFCYKHGVKSMFDVRRKASACPTIAQHSVCCYQRFSESQLCCSSIN